MFTFTTDLIIMIVGKSNLKISLNKELGLNKWLVKPDAEPESGQRAIPLRMKQSIQIIRNLGENINDKIVGELILYKLMVFKAARKCYIFIRFKKLLTTM